MSYLVDQFAKSVTDAQCACRRLAVQRTPNTVAYIMGVFTTAFAPYPFGMQY